MTDQKPQFIITYKCSGCAREFTGADNRAPECFYCSTSEGHEELKKEEITPELLEEKMKASMDRMMESLKKAYDVKPEDVDEEELLEAMAKAKNLQEKIEGLELKEDKEE